MSQWIFAIFHTDVDLCNSICFNSFQFESIQFNEIHRFNPLLCVVAPFWDLAGCYVVKIELLPCQGYHDCGRKDEHPARVLILLKQNSFDLARGDFTDLRFHAVLEYCTILLTTCCQMHSSFHEIICPHRAEPNRRDEHARNGWCEKLEKSKQTRANQGESTYPSRNKRKAQCLWWKEEWYSLGILET